MLKSSLQAYLNDTVDDFDVGVVVCSLDTGEEIALSYDAIIDINDYGEPVIVIYV